MLCIKATITGKVQRVFYRDNTRKQAQALNITGWVKNRDDGAVELVACGDEDNIRLFIDWLWQGPPRAQVSHVQWEVIDDEAHERFVIAR